MESDDDDPFFDPRLRWAAENCEDLGAIHFKKFRFDFQHLIIKFLESGPKTCEEIMNEFKLKKNEVHRHLWELRRGGAEVETVHYKYEAARYSLISKDRFKFYVNK